MDREAKPSNLSAADLSRTWAIQFIIALSIHFTNPITAIYATELGADIALAGTIASMVSVSGLLILLPMGVLSDRFGRVPLLLLCSIVATLSGFLYITRDPLILTAARLLHGIAFGSQVLTWAMVMNATSPDRRGRNIGILGSALSAAGAAGPIISGFSVQYSGFQSTFLLTALLAAPSVILTLHLARSKSAMAILDKSVISSIDEKVKLVKNFRRMLKGLLTGMFGGLGFATFFFYFPLFATGLRMEPSAIGLIIGIGSASQVLTRASLGWISDIMGRTKVIVLGFTLTSLSMLTMLVAGDFYAFLVASFIANAGQGLMYPAGAASVADGVSKEKMGFAMGLWQGSILLGISGLSPLMGFVAQNYGFTTLFTFNSLIPLIVITVIAMFLRK